MKKTIFFKVLEIFSKIVKEDFHNLFFVRFKKENGYVSDDLRFFFSVKK